MKPSALAIVAVAALAAFGCKKKPAQDPQGLQQQQCGGYGQQPCQQGACGGYGQPACTGAQASCGGYGQPACGTQAACGGVGQPACAATPACGGAGQPACATSPVGQLLQDPNALQQIITGMASAVGAQLGGMTGGELGPVKAGIEQNAKDNAKGMKPDGQLLSAKLSQGGHAEGTVTLQPGKCYSVVGFGSLGVMRYQINVAAAPPAPPAVMAQSRDDGVQPVVAPNELCLRSPSPVAMPVKIDLFLVQGTGMVGAQLYSK